ncbi:MAG TPA: hypothetical protein VHW90_01545 [Stellaceae bacterium]|nr:hypothetical protein [Stellaceae bacterium]
MLEKWRRKALALAAVAAVLGVVGTALAFETPPVRVVVDGRMVVRGATGDGLLPVAVSQDWSRPLPNVTRAVIVVHGAHRAAEPLFRGVAQMAPDSGTLVIAPQFLEDKDIVAHALPDNLLRWGRWATAGDATGPIAASSYDAIDALLLTVADRSRFPNLRNIVLAGFSGGGQLVQRYAATGRGGDTVARSGIRVRYVVGSPSSYVYFGDDRPAGQAAAASCPNFNRWPYGLAANVPRYVEASVQARAATERRYAGLDVVYLVGAADNDPNHWELDKSCGAEAEGTDRYTRALNYFRFMQARDGAILRQRFATAPGAGHDALAVLGSPCGRAALFDMPGCPAS